MKLRYAPPATGLLNVGQARIALANWLLARRHDAPFVLRLDDTAPDVAETIEYDLKWLGLDWDETALQSCRTAVYDAAAERLKASGRLYPCFESEEELNAKREQRVRRNQAPIYDRAMLNLTDEQRANAEAGGKRPHWRFRLSGVPAAWGDMVLGPQEVKLSAVSDPVLLRADGTPLYTFTSVVDDLDLGVTHIVRGADHVTSTGVELDIMAALGAVGRQVPVRFAHLPPLLDAGAKPGKRANFPSLRSLRNDGVEPATLAGTLARLGTKDAPVAAAARELAQTYDLTRMAKTSPSFDARQLLALNRKALKSLPFEAVQDRLPPAATAAFWLAVRGHLDLMREARGWWDVVTGTIVPPVVENEAHFLHEALETLPPEPWAAETFWNWTAAIRARTNRSGKSLMIPLRLALSGEDHGPDLAALLPLMGRARVAERLRMAAA